MTVSFGHLFLTGVVVIADSRISTKGGGPWGDSAQKVFFLNEKIIIAFAGDIEAAAMIIDFLVKAIKQKPELGELSTFVETAPALIKAAWEDVPGEVADKHVAFIVAGMDFDKPLIPTGVDGVQNRTVGLYERRVVAINSMEDFEPEEANMEYPSLIIGTGSAGLEVLRNDFAKSQNGMLPSKLDFHASIMEISLRKEIKGMDIDSVGGLSQIAVIDSHSSRFLTYEGGDPIDGTPSAMLVKNNRFIQKNLKTGEEIPLLYPPEVVQLPPDAGRLFGKLDELV
ncbi:hypothetical protein K2Q08_01235 [Patescibacteria group bacterium]|nr:hypothetical protein [Patescibacteria group bacterium]